jgi:hypothetical protein
MTFAYQNKSKNKQVYNYGCYVASLYNFKALYQNYDCTVDELNIIWEKGKKLGYIDNNPKSKTYLEIVNPQALVDMMELPLKFVSGHFKPDTIIPEKTFVIGQYYNKRTNFKHFLVIDPVTKKIIFDPIYPSSISAKEGYLYSMRFYLRTDL